MTIPRTLQVEIAKVGRNLVDTGAKMQSKLDPSVADLRILEEIMLLSENTIRSIREAVEQVEGEK